MDFFYDVLFCLTCHNYFVQISTVTEDDSVSFSFNIELYLNYTQMCVYVMRGGGGISV